MKKFMQFISLPAIALVLAACGNNTSTPETTTAVPEITTVAPETTTEAQVITPTDETTTSEGEETDTDSDSTDTSESDDTTASSDVEANDVPFKIYVNGELKHEFVAKDAVGGNVLSAMESIEELDFYFDEEAGFITTIDNIENDYAASETWVYLLNGQYVEYGVVSQTLSEGDEVQWYFGSVDELPVNIIPAAE